MVEGTSTFGYDRGEFTARVPVKAGEQFLRASFPELADLADPRAEHQPRQRRGLFVDYLDIVGPFNPSTEPPDSYQQDFRLRSRSRQAHRRVRAQADREPDAPRLPPPVTQPKTMAEVQARAAGAARKATSIDEGVRLALQAILVSPDFLFHIETRPQGRHGPGCRRTSGQRP